MDMEQLARSTSNYMQVLSWIQGGNLNTKEDFYRAIDDAQGVIPDLESEILAMLQGNI